MSDAPETGTGFLALVFGVDFWCVCHGPLIEESLSATVVSAEPFSHGTMTLRCLQKEMATYRH